jgi:hypothetical protein
METVRLSQGFQTALGILVTNGVIARKFLAGEIRAADFSTGLTDDDVAALEALLSEQRPRVFAVASILTSRRRGKAMKLMPVTARIVSGRLHPFWQEYLSSRPAAEPLPRPIEDANAFGCWMVKRLGPQSLEAQMIRFELCQNDVALRAYSRGNTSIETRAATLPEGCVVRFSEHARLERFESAIDRCMADYLNTGKLPPCAGDPVWVIFHPSTRRHGAVVVTKVTPAMGAVLVRTQSEVGVSALLSEVTHERREAMRAGLARLADMRILDVLAA